MRPEKDWLFAGDNDLCGLRVAGVLVRDGKLLLQREQNGSEYALPGGHVKIGETLENAVLREFREETGAEIRVLRMLWSEEAFWEYEGVRRHSISFYFLVEECPGSELPDTGEFVANRDNVNVEMGWMDIAQLQGITVYPEFLAAQIGRLDGAYRHFVSGQ